MPQSSCADRLPDNILTRIEDEARAVALAFGVVTPNALAASLLDRLRMNVGGGKIYLPKSDWRQRARRNAAIRAKFKGNNIDELAREHGLSERWIRRIVAGGRS